MLELVVGRREASVGLRQVVVVVVVVGAVVVGSGAAARLADSASRSFRYNLVVHTFFSPFNFRRKMSIISPNDL